MSKSILIGLFALLFAHIPSSSFAQTPFLNELEYFESQGADYIIFSNWYNGLFSDSKISGIEIIHHGDRVVTNGDIRLDNTPEQWDLIPTFIKREVDSLNGYINTYNSYPEYEFEYIIRGEAIEGGVAISIHIEEELPNALQGVAGFNLEFIPSAFWEYSYMMNGKSFNFPHYPFSDMGEDDEGNTYPLAMSSGSSFVAAPENPERMITVKTNGSFSLYDGRDKAQNGWFVLRELLPSNKTGEVLRWEISANTIEGWLREPMIAYSQVGYHPDQSKKATIELDKRDTKRPKMSLIRYNSNGTSTIIKSNQAEEWGRYKRYNYLQFDFSEVTEEGVYAFKFGDKTTSSFRIAADVYDDVWKQTSDIFMPVQMDHVLVNEAYRVWHGASHLDDALQAPINHEHFDLYAQGDSTDSPFKPGEHIPGLNVGGWYDAGDYDIRTQSQYSTVQNLVILYEMFGIDRDQTTVDQAAKYVDLHNPDGMPDVLQQIEHGVLFLLSPYESIGHAIPGVIVPDISQYTHLGDGLTMTDNLIYNAEMGELESNGIESGKFDDRWAFTNKSSTLDYGTAGSLAAASRVLGSINPELAEKAFNKAIEIWEHEQNNEPIVYRYGNTTGGSLFGEELKATIELLITTQEKKYSDHLRTLIPELGEGFFFPSTLLIRAIPYMDQDYSDWLESRLSERAEQFSQFQNQNPFGVFISEGGWAGNGGIMNQGFANYMIHKTFPDLADKDQVFNALNYMFGHHPDHNLSFVTGVGTKTKKVAYGMNRADFSYIPGGPIPGVLILNPDFPENREDWPFFWGQNEYVIPMGPSYMLLANAVKDLLRD